MKQEKSLKEIMEQLTYYTRDWSFSRILKESQNGNWMQRPFNDEWTWSPIKATFFIESVLLRCELHPLIILEKQDESVICDGYNRLITLIKFFRGELVLVEKGLEKLTFLANYKFEDLEEDYKKYLLQDCTFKILIYQLPKSNLELTKEDYDNVEKQLYICYNMGIQLKPYQIQKAEFCNDTITQIIKQMITTDPVFEQQLRQLKIIKDEKDAIDVALTIIHSLIASTYAPLDYYLRQKSKNAIARNAYTPFIQEKNKNEIIQTFQKSIERLSKLFEKFPLENYPKLNHYSFIEASYWLISTIIKDHLLSIYQFDDNAYIQYCIDHDIPDGYFVHPLSGHHEKQKRFLFVAEFLKLRYAINLSHYFEPYKIETKPIKNIDEIPLFDELANKKYRPASEEKDVDDICELMKKNCFLLRPYYQRSEQRNLRASSGILQSLMVGIRVPDILIYRYIKNNRQIYEVVDGQQRCLSVLAYLNKNYLDENGEFQTSNKNGFKLTNLKILTELENCTYDKSKHKLPEEYKKKLEKADIHLTIIDQKDNPDFDPIEHYIRINSNINPLKIDSYLMWNVACDKLVMQKLNDTTKQHIHRFFPSKSKNKNFETLLTIFVYHEYQKLKSIATFRKWRNVSNRDLTSWLENITDQNRFQYLDCIQKVDTNLTKVESWLEFIDETPNSLYNLGKNLKVSNQKLDFLYYLLSDIEEDILFKHHRKIEDLIFTMGRALKQEKLKILEKQEILQSTKTQLKNVQFNYYHSEKVTQ